MFCRHCRTIIPDDSIFCENCGARVKTEEEQEQVSLHTTAEIPMPGEDADPGSGAEKSPEAGEPAEDGIFTAPDADTSDFDVQETVLMDESAFADAPVWQEEAAPEEEATEMIEEIPEEISEEVPEEIPEETESFEPEAEPFEFEPEEPVDFEPGEEAAVIEAEEFETSEDAFSALETEFEESEEGSEAEPEEAESFDWNIEEPEPEAEDGEEFDWNITEEQEETVEAESEEEEDFNWNIEEPEPEAEGEIDTGEEEAFDWNVEEPEPETEAGPEDDGEFNWRIEETEADEAEETERESAEEPADDSVKSDPIWWEPPEESAAGGGSEETAQEDLARAEELLETDREESMDHVMDHAMEAIAEKSEHAMEKIRSGIHDLGDVTKEKESDLEEQVKPYLRKAKKWLGSLGKTVRTGTGWAVDAVREQAENLHSGKEEISEEDFEEDEEQTPGFWYQKKSEPAPEMSSETGDPDAEESAEAEPAGEEPEEPEPDRQEEEDPDTQAASEPEAEPDEQPEEQAEETDDEQPEESEDQTEEELTEAPEERAEEEFQEKLEEESEKAVPDTGEQEPADSSAEEQEEEEEPGETPVDTRSFGEKVKERVSMGNLSTKTKIGIIAAIVLAVVILIIGISYGSKVHKENEAIRKYDASVVRVEQLIENQEYSSAEKLYLKMIKFDPARIEAYEGLAQLYVSQGRYDEATNIIERGSANAGDSKVLAGLTDDIAALTDTSWKDIYIDVLKEHEREIKQYERDVDASTSYCDINGDRKPELFFFTKEYYGYGKLRIYTIADGTAKEVIYDCRNRGTQYQDAFYDVGTEGASYAIFKTKDENGFAIYANILHGNSWSTTNEYALNLQGGCKQTNVIEGSIATTYSESEKDRSEYLRNEEEITYEEYNTEFQRVLDSVDQVILYNREGGDQAVWDKISPENVMCLPFDAMIKDLETR